MYGARLTHEESVGGGQTEKSPPGHGGLRRSRVGAGAGRGDCLSRLQSAQLEHKTLDRPVNCRPTPSVGRALAGPRRAAGSRRLSTARTAQSR